jgi:hypothetical protein
MSGTHQSGRRSKSLTAHRLAGTLQPSRHGRLGDPPVPPSAPVTKPGRLSARAADIWDELAPIALAMATLTTADVPAFAVLCELSATLAWACSLKTSDPARFSPRLERETAAALRPYYALFGLTPEARSRLHLAPAADPAGTPLDRFLKRSKWDGLR